MLFIIGELLTLGFADGVPGGAPPPPGMVTADATTKTTNYFLFCYYRLILFQYCLLSKNPETTELIKQFFRHSKNNIKSLQNNTLRVILAKQLQ